MGNASSWHERGAADARAGVVAGWAGDGGEFCRGVGVGCGAEWWRADSSECGGVEVCEVESGDESGEPV